MNSFSTNDKIISNFVQGAYWKNEMKDFNGKVIVPLIKYQDDYNNNNPLGSRKGVAKTGGVYLSIPVLPPQYQAKIENIIVFLLFNTLDRAVFKNQIIFTKAIDELNYLNDVGIEITLPTGIQKIYFLNSGMKQGLFLVRKQEKKFRISSVFGETGEKYPFLT